MCYNLIQNVNKIVIYWEREPNQQKPHQSLHELYSKLSTCPRGTQQGHVKTGLQPLDEEKIVILWSPNGEVKFEPKLV